MTLTEIQHEPLPSATSHDTPVVFVVDDDISVRESLELLIESADWTPQIFAWQRSSWRIRDNLFRAVLCSTSTFRT